MHRRVLPRAVFAFLFCISLRRSGATACPSRIRAGRPLGPIQECADLFSAANQVKVLVTASPEPQWFSEAQKDADLIFGGAEYMLSDFASRRPEILDEKSRVDLYLRPAGILVRKGNPKKINSVADLTKPGLRILEVNGSGQVGLLKEVADKAGVMPAIQKNIAMSVRNSVQAVDQWRADPKLDALVSFESWQYRLDETADLVRLPEAQQVYRATQIAIAKAAPNRALAEKFIAFLQSDQGHAVFQKWGWK